MKKIRSNQPAIPFNELSEAQFFRVSTLKHIERTNKMFFFLFIKVTNNYYQKHKERLVKKAREKYQNYSEKEKGKR